MLEEINKFPSTEKHRPTHLHQKPPNKFGYLSIYNLF